MKKLHNFLIKAFSMCLAFILVFPTNLFAMGLDGTKTKKYSATASIMGLAPNDDSGEENTDTSLLETEVSSKETDQYLIEKSARLSKTTGQIDYEIKVIAKDKGAEDKISASFAISQNTDLKDLKLEKVCQIRNDHSQEEIKYQEQRPSILYTNDSFETLGVTTENKDLVYYLSAKLTDEALAAINDKSPIMDLTFNIGAHLQDNYSLSIGKHELKGEDGQENKSIQTLKEEPVKQIKAIFKEKTSSLLGEKPAEIIWTDYIKASDDHSYDIELDQSQDTSESTIKVTFYQASEKGYIIKDEHSQTMDFAQSLNLQIPKDQIAKIEVSTKVKGNPKSFTYNNKEIPNPYYKEQTSQAEEKSDDKENTEKDEDPLPVDSAKEQTSAKSSDDIISDDISTDTLKEESQSAIELNKEAYIQNVENKKPVNQIAKALAAYNNNEIDFDQVKASVESISKDQNLGESQTQEIIEALLIGLNEENHKAATINPADLTVDIKEAMEEEEPKLTDAEIKDLIKEEFAKKDAGQITEEELETSLATIREDNNIDKEAFFNILAYLYKNAEIENDGEENPSEKEESIDTEKTKEEALAEKLAEENLSTEDFIRFLQSYVKSYDIKEDELESILKDNQVEVEKVIADFTIDEIVAAAYLDGLNPHVFAAEDNTNVIDSGFANEDFMTELEYKTVTLSNKENIGILQEIVRKFDPVSSDQQITDAYVGWRINIPGSDPSGWDLQELKSAKYAFSELGISLYAPDDQGLRNYYIRITEAGSGRVISSGYMKQNGSHLTYGTDILKANLPSDGINIDVVAEAPVKRQSYTIGLRVTPDNNYITTLANQFKDKYEELKQKYPFLIKWKDTSQADPYKGGLNLVDTRMVYTEPKDLQEKTPFTPYISKEYTDNNTDTDTGIGKNTFTMFGNLDDDDNLTWTISETMTLEKLYGDGASKIGNSAYSLSGYSSPNVEILVPNGSSYTAKELGQIDKTTLQNNLKNAVPGTIVNYTYTKKVDDPKTKQSVAINHFGPQEVSVQLKDIFDGENDPALENYDNSKLDQQPNTSGYEVALREPDFMWAFKPLEPNKNPRNQDKGIDLNGVLAYCINMGKKYPTRSNGFNKTMTKVPLTSSDGNKITEKLNNPRLTGTPSTPENVMDNIRKVFWYADQMQKEYNFDTQTFYRIVQYNIFYYTSTDAEQYAYQFGQNMLPGAMRTYAEELKNRVAAGKGWNEVDEDQVHVYIYEHSDKSRQTVIAGDVHAKDKAKVGRLEVRKYDSKTSDNLYGAIFELRKSNNELIGRASTDSKGIARFDDIPVGTGYKLVEVKAPAGYIKDTQERTITITDFSTTQVPVRANVPNSKPEIELTKVDENQKAINGARFKLRRNGVDVAGSEVSSNDKGIFAWSDGLTPGSYEVVEVSLPTGYENYSDNIGKVVYRFRVNANNEIDENSKENLTNKNNTSNVIVNKKDQPKKGQIEFTKKDSTSGKVLAGAEFILEYKKTGSTIYKKLPGTRKTTDTYGKISWKELEAGDYRVIETKVPGKDYETEINLGEKATFTVSQDGETYTVKDVKPNNKVITNQTKPKEGEGSFEFEKIDADTNEKLQGVEFTLESINQVSDGVNTFKYKASKTSDANGKIKFDKLLPGEYKLTETKPLVGYKKNTETWKVVVDKDGTTKVYDDAGNDLTMPLKGNYIFEGNNKVVTNKAKYTFSLSESDQSNIVDLNLTIEPQATRNKATIYYVYDDDKNKNLLDNLGLSNNSAKVAKIIPIKVNNKDEYTRHIQTAYLSSGLRNDSNGILVSYITNDYANQITSKEIEQMVTGKRKDVDSTNKPLFAYYKNTSNNLSTIYKTGENSHGFYKDGVGDHPDFKELVDFINSGALGSTDKNVYMQYSANSAIEVDEGLSSGNFNTFFRNGKYLIPGTKETIVQKIKVNPELVKNNYNSEVMVFDQITIRSFAGSDKLEYGANLPRIKVSEGSDSNTGSATVTSQGFTISNEKEEPKPANLTIKKVDSKTKVGLEGAKFRIYNTKNDAENDNFYLQEVTTNEHGYAIFDSVEIMPNTTYYVKEIAAPDGYKISKKITEVKSSATADNTINAEIPNEKNNARFELYKKDGDGRNLAGVKFELKNNTTNKVETLTTNSNGFISYDKLEADTSYELKEIKTLDGYILNNSKATITVDKDGNVSWNENSLITEKYDPNNKVVTETTTKETPLGAWKSKDTTYTNPSQAYPSYMNTLDYAEYNPTTKEVTHYIMLKPDADINGGKTDRATTLNLSSSNAKIKSVILYDGGSGTTKASYKEAMQKQNISLQGSTATAQNSNKNISIKMGTTSSDGSVRSSMTGLSTNSAYIKFPYDKNKKQGRFDADWGMLVKVVASVEDDKKASSMSFNWTTDEPNQLSTSSTQNIPALIKTEEIPGKTTSPSPTFTVINEKRPSINFVKEDVASGDKLYGAQFVLFKGTAEVDGSLTSSDKYGKFGFHDLEDGSYTVYETASPDGYPYIDKKKNVASFTVSDGNITSLKTNPDYGNTETSEFDSNKNYIIYNKANEIKFRKVGENNTSLSGGKFEIRKVSNSDDGRNTTVENSEKSANEKGELVWSIKEPGRYQVVETEAPTDYKEVGKDGLVVAEFTVAKETLEITNILVGDKFYLDTQAKDFPTDGFVNIENKKQGIGSFELTKTDFSSKVLENAKFLLEDKATGTYIKADGSQENELRNAIVTTDTSGKINYNKLSNGTYILREYESPDGYIKSKNVWQVVVQGTSTTISLSTIVNQDESSINGSKLTVKNRGNKITFEKQDNEDSTKKLQGAQFVVYREKDYTNWEGNTGYEQYEVNGTKVFTTDKNGKLVLENLKMGHYKVYERKAPDGYYVEDDLAENDKVEMPGLEKTDKYVAEFYVDINGYIKADQNDNGQTTELIKVIKNTAHKGEFKLLKVDNTDKELRLAQFKLTKDGDSGFEYTGTSTSDGLIEFKNLTPGTYTLEEIKAPEGYVPSKQKWQVKVDEKGQVTVNAKGKTDSDDAVTTGNIVKLSDDDKKKLNEYGYLIAKENDTTGENKIPNIATIKVVNKKPSLPTTGGAGVKIAFALIGTAVMITALAYFGIINTSKTRRR